LRTAEGVDFEYIKNNFGNDYANYFSKNIQKFIFSKKILPSASGHFSLAREGILISDEIIRELMI